MNGPQFSVAFFRNVFHCIHICHRLLSKQAGRLKGAWNTRDYCALHILQKNIIFSPQLLKLGAPRFYITTTRHPRWSAFSI